MYDLVYCIYHRVIIRCLYPSVYPRAGNIQTPEQANLINPKSKLAHECGFGSKMQPLGTKVFSSFFLLPIVLFRYLILEPSPCPSLQVTESATFFARLVSHEGQSDPAGTLLKKGPHDLPRSRRFAAAQSGAFWGGPPRQLRLRWKAMFCSYGMLRQFGRSKRDERESK